jgi:hypothetical protein
MLEAIALAALASTAATAPAVRRSEESFVTIRQEQSASLEQATESVFNKFNTESVTTYQADPPFVGNEDLPFVSPVVSSFSIKAKLKVGRNIVQPPIDIEDIVYFDD